MSPRVVVVPRQPIGTADRDLVLDIERFIDAVRAPHESDARTDTGQHLRHVAIGSFRGALERAVRLHDPGVTVWIVHPYPTAAQVTQYRSRGFEVRPT